MSKKQVKNRRLTAIDSEEKSILLPRLRHLLVLSVAVLLIVSSVYVGAKVVSNIVHRPVAEISVESNFSYVHHQAIMDLINNTLHQSFLSENLTTVKTALEKNAWIDTVVLSRQWPDHLRVKIVEQVPIARWSTIGFINYRGELVPVGGIKRLAHLPTLAGPVGDSVEVLKQYQVISKLLRNYDLEIASLMKSEHHRWTIELANGWKINIGKGQLMEKMQRFTVVLKDQLLPYKDSIAVIDIRYQHGVAVKWLENDDINSVLQVNNVSFVDGI